MADAAHCDLQRFKNTKSRNIRKYHKPIITSWKHHGNIIETSYKPTKGDERVLQNLSEYLRVSQSLGEIEEIHKNVMESHLNAVVLCRAKSKWPEMWQCSLHPYLAKRHGTLRKPSKFHPNTGYKMLAK
jgi:hypothetical protein